MDDLLASTVLSRRRFLQRLSLAGGALLADGLFRNLAAVDTPARPLHVIVVGAGVAGLCAALELEKRGHTVTVLEADRSHIGGRVRTLRFSDGIYGEAGAMRIPQNHTLTRRYIREMGLTLRPFVQSNPDAYYYVRGQKIRRRDVHRLNSLYRLGESERTLTPDDLWERSLLKRLKGLSDAERADISAESFATGTLRGLDQLSLQQLCEQAGLSSEAIEMLAVAYGQETLMTTALTEHLREERDGVWAGTFDEIVGGTDRLPSAMESRLKSRVKRGCEVTRLEQDGVAGRVAAVYREGDRSRRVEGDYLICTLPLPVLGRIDTDPAFSGEKRAAIRNINYDSSTKVLAITKRRFWESDEGIYGGGTYTDLMTGTTYYPADNAAARDPAVSARPAAFLASYNWGQTARRLATLSHRERADLVLHQLSAVHPALTAPGMVQRTASWSWDNHRGSGGAFAWFLPGQHTLYYRHLLTPEGRIYLAGEHASLTHTWIQGALESGLSAVTRILAAGPAR